MTLAQALNFKNLTNEKGEFTLPKLNYSYDVFEPFLSAQAMEIHHAKHHQTYVMKLNEAIGKQPELSKLSVEEILSDLNQVNDNIKTAVRNHGGGHANHSLYWSVITSETDVEPSSKLAKAIEKHFINQSSFEEQIFNAAISLFGSGWAWLSVNKQKELFITTTQNQDTPLSDGCIPILTIDVWEHAYYLNFQNRRADFVKELVRHIDWQNVSIRHENAIQSIK